MAEYADPFPERPKGRYEDAVDRYLSERIAALKESERLTPQIIAGTGFTLTYTGSLSDVVDQLQRRALLA
jgi:hypothetical protein